jgi:hypothetical protein
LNPERDPGLAAERTQIAWGRNALAFATCLAIALRRVPSMSHWTAFGLLLVAAVTIAAITVVLRHRLVANAAAPAIDVTQIRLRNVAVLTSAIGAVCLVVVLAAL